MQIPIFVPMHWKDVIGHSKLKNLLAESIEEGRVSHAQLFVGKEGCGAFPLALAYASEILRAERPDFEEKIESLNHLDLHFSFPVYTVSKSAGKMQKGAFSSNFLSEWTEMVKANPYFSYADWAAKLEAEKKVLLISVDEVRSNLDDFSLTSFEGGTRILILYGLDKMAAPAANSFLKFLEEPPAETVILLIAESLESLLETITSRCQIIEVPAIAMDDIAAALEARHHLNAEQAKAIAARSQGNWSYALDLISNDEASAEFEAFLIRWVRDAFQARVKPAVIAHILRWAEELASWDREKQRRFLAYCTDIFRYALLQGYGCPELVYKRLSRDRFKWEGFVPFIHGANIESILEELSRADLHLMRNGNPRIVWTDMGIKLTRYIHRKAV